jgi:transaldolase
MPGRRPAVFLDRDGVVNRAVVRDGRPYPPASVAELEILPGVGPAIAALHAAGVAVIIVTNQPDVARGTTSRDTVEAIHRRLRQELAIDAIFVCWHDDRDGCDCRKPKPGLILAAASAFHVDLARSVLVGDRWKDIAAGKQAGLATVLIDYRYREPAPPSAPPPDLVVGSLPEAIPWIVHRTRNEGLMHEGLRVKIFADGAETAGMLELARQPWIAGFTTNPTLMRKAGITDYRAFAKEVLGAIPDRPISFEVFSDEPTEMERQACAIASWGDNVYVKIPVTNTRGEWTDGLARRLVRDGVKVNVTALTTLGQVRRVAEALAESRSSYISVFAGRVADTGRDPVPLMAAAVELLRPHPGLELIWASPREVLNVYQADQIGCHIITVTTDLLKKLPLYGKDLDAYSLETVRQFHEDAVAAGYAI